jgi:hypothetical protein
VTMFGPAKKGPETGRFSRIAYKNIPAVVEEMRQYCMLIRFRSRQADVEARTAYG